MPSAVESSGGITSLATTSPLTGGPITDTGTIAFNKNVDLQMTSNQLITVTDAGTTAVVNILTLAHDTSGTAAAGFGAGIFFKLQDSTTADMNAGQISTAWSDATHATKASYIDFQAVTGGSAVTASVMRLFGSGGLAINSTVDPGAGAVRATTIELGAATDTTIARSGAGAITVEGVQVLLSGAALGTPLSGTLTNCTFPTLNQNTSGSAASLSVSGQTGLFTITGLTSSNRIKTVRDAADTILELAGSYTPSGTWTSLTMVTPVLGTPTSGDLRNCTAATDSVAGVISAADHTTLTALSTTAGASGVAPAFVAVGFLVTAVKTGVDMKSAATTTIFTVPASRTFVCTGSFVSITAVTAGGAGTQTYQIKESSSARIMTAAVASASTTPVAGQSVYFELLPNAAGYTVLSTCAAGNSVQIVVTASHAGSTAVTGSVFVTGFYST